MRNKILAKADALFSKEGVREVSIDDICHELGISKKTFYQYYAQKEDLICDVLFMRTEARGVAFMKSTLGMDSISTLASVFDKISKKRYLDRDSRDLMDVQKYYPETFSKFLAKKGQIARERFVEGFERGKKEGVVRQELDTETTMTMFFLLHQSVVSYIKGQMELFVKKLPFKSIASAYEDIFVRSVLSEEGMRQYQEYRNNQINNK